MKKIKKYSINIFLAFVVLILAFMPISISKIEGKKLLGKVYTTEIKVKKQIQNSLASIEDKLELIVRYQKKDQNVVMIEKKEREFNDKELSSLVIREIKRMQTVGAFPDINLQGDVQAKDFSSKIFIDKNKPQGVVSIWNIYFSYGEYDSYVSMDANTYKIYEFDVYSKYEIPKINVSLLSKSISKYLDIALDKGPYYSYYDSKIYTLTHGRIKYAYSYNKHYTSLCLLIRDM